MSSKKKEKDPWTKCEQCEAYFPRAKFSLHSQDACQRICEGKNEASLFTSWSPVLPKIGFVLDGRFLTSCSTYKLEG